MKTQPFRFILYSIMVYLTLFALSSSTVIAHYPSVGDGPHSHEVTDWDSNQPDKQYSDQFPNRRYARTFATNLNVGEPRTVRMIYFLPNDRRYRAEVVQKMKDDIRTIQTFFADQMEAHGYGRLTFRIETDAQGEPIVHQVNARRPDSHYLDTTEDIVIGEIEQRFNLRTTNHYLVVVDNSINALGGEFGGRIGGEAGGVEDKAWGYGIVHGGYNWRLAAHELGHAFGLWHDFRDGAYIMSYGPGQNRLSACHAAFLAVHPYFDPNIPVEDGSLPTIELISPRTYPAGLQNVPVRLKISDSSGLQWGILFIAGDHTKSPEVKACRGLVGNREAIVEFDYDGVIPSNGSTSLSSPLVHPIYFEAIDTDGDVGRATFVLFSEALEPLSKISGDNQHGLPNTPLPVPFVVEVRDLNEGWGRRGVPVTFAVTAGGGSLSRVRTETDRLGRAESTLTLGPRLEDNRVEVSAEGLTVTFTAVAGAGVEIPDPNLRAAIESTLGKAPGTPIAPAEMAILTRLDAPNANISDLTGLQYATNLTELWLGGGDVKGEYVNSNTVSDLSPLAGLTNLTRLNLWGNNVSDLAPVAGLTKLIGLWLGWNNISDSSVVADLTNLTELGLEGNNILDISAVAGLTKLTWLNLGANSVLDISAVAGLTKLTWLNLGGNSITDILAVAGLTHLTRLYLWNNSVSDTSALVDLTNLTELHLNGNVVSDISGVSGLTSLTRLRLGHNSITDISAVSGLTNLTKLQLGHNSISDLSPLVTNTGLGNGDEVDVSGNPLSYHSIHTHISALQSRGVTVEFDNRAHPALLKISGDNQTGAAFAPLSQPFVVEAQDANGSALAGISMRFAVTAGGGTLNTTITRTNPNGRAQSTLTLGPNLGTNTVSVSATGIEVPVTFYAISDTEAPLIIADVNNDGSVNVLDLILITSNLDNRGSNLAADVNRDGIVNILDLVLVAGMFDGAAAPSAHPQIPKTLTAVEVQGWLTDARALEVRGPIMKRGFMVLEQLLLSLTPKETELLPNYPNPFNPETWIPYRLAEDAFVRLTIYDASGRVVRTLDVGHRIASAYENRSKAIYWDGRNDVGEPVASGVYFYTLTAGNYSATRRMVILK